MQKCKTEQKELYQKWQDAKINKDFAEAAEEYDFFGASSGLPNAPDFIKTSKDKE